MSYSVYAQLIKEKGIKTATVSKATGIPQSVFADWKKGRYEPKIDKIKKIADYLGVTPEYIMTGEETEGYYINPETARKAQEIFDTPGMSALFDAARDAKPEDLHKAADFLKAAKALSLGLNNED